MKLTNSMASHFQRFQTFAINRMVPSSLQKEDGLTYWRVRILFAVIFTGVLIGFATLVPVVSLVIKGNLWGLLIVDGALWIISVGLLLIRGLKYNIRAGIALLILYSMGLGIIISVGLLSGGPVSLFTFAVLTGVLLGSKAAIIALIVNALTLTVVGWLINTGLFGQTFPFFNNMESMVAAGATFMLLNTIAAMSVAVLVKGLIATLQKERDFAIILTREQSHLLEVKKELESEIEVRKQAEEKLRETQEFLEAAVAQSPSGILIADAPNVNIRLANQAAFSIRGIDSSILTGMDVAQHAANWQILHSDGSRYPYEQMPLTRAVRQGEVTQNEEVIIRNQAGNDHWLSVNAAPILDANGHIIAGILVFHDITEHKQAQEALKKSEEKYRLLAENVNDVIWTMDMDLNYTYISPAIEKIQGWNVEEAASLTINDVLTPKSLEIVLKRFEAHMTEGAKTGNYNISDRFELEMYRKRGSTIWTEIVASPILGEDGKPVGILGVTRDITERKKLETQLQRAQKMEAIGTLAGGVAHDLNNVLSAQVSYPDLLLMDLPEESPLRKPILTIKKSGEKAAAIVQDLLTLARRGVVATEVVNFNRIIEDYIGSPECENLRKFHPDVNIQTDLEPCLLNIMGSSVHLSTTVMNMVSNAAEAMPGGGNIFISTRSKYIDKPIRGYDDVQEGDYVVFTVSDSGTGISSRDLEKIFEPFYTKKVMGRSGTGLGMAVVWGTVKDHRGYIDVQSVEGKGTTFTIYFPVTRKEIGITEKALLMEAYVGNGESILVVDDIDEQREIAFNILHKLNYAVTSVSSGEEAVDYLKNNSADVLVLDMIMDPGINGLATYKKILEFHPKQKAIITSGFSETDLVKEVQKLGAGKYLKKPYTLEKIGLSVKAELEK
jgi:PAS domain S-box-containing protein